ncbi:PopZ family protein [Labrys neptuniae]
MSSPTRADPPRTLKEPSMDEILSSIRRIISDDPPPARPGRRAPLEASTQEEPSAPAAPSEISSGPIAANVDRGPAPLLSAMSESETASAFASLNHTIFSKNARTIEDVVQEMLRPMLQSWLDAHLPTLVERLVRQEIERISGRQ